MARRERIELGEYIVADPEICHGQLTFKGTRIMVNSVLEMLAEGYTWDRVSKAYDGLRYLAVCQTCGYELSHLLRPDDSFSFLAQIFCSITCCNYLLNCLLNCISFLS